MTVCMHPEIKLFKLQTFLMSIALCLLTHVYELKAETLDPFDPFDNSSFEISTDEEGDKDKSAKQLILEAAVLLDDERLLDARTKLLRALQRDPLDYRAHLMLSGYYLDHVGHFRLSLKYAKRALDLFYKAKGYPPYSETGDRMSHQQLLYLISQIRLNLDDYAGSLRTLDEFNSYGYTAPWYSGSRAWVLMKLGKVEDAIKIAKQGVQEASEPGRTLNMLGILLSMHGEREAALKVFREAITYELSMGRIGQPATPLNNSGEVYKEIFKEEEAERSWLRATSLPDGCEHVLPSLNLALIYIDELNLPAAKRAIDSFEACVAQYPLRNGEEHKALVALARGRIALHAGNIDESLTYLNDALEKRQWFGKIGTSLEDLEVALFISLGQAYAYKNHHLESTLSNSAFSYINLQKITFFNWIKSAWYFRQARRILAEDLNDIEDLYIRNTDSLIEYPTFGELLSGYPHSVLTLKIKNIKSLDTREHANIFYNLYLAESYLDNGLEDKGLQILSLIVPKMRMPYDHLMYIRALMLSIRKTSPQNPDYSHIAQKILAISPGALRNYGLKLPVNIQSENISFPESLMTKSPFFVEKARALPYLITLIRLDNGYKLSFKSQDPKVRDKTVTGSTLEETINKFSDSVFSENMG